MNKWFLGTMGLLVSALAFGNGWECVEKDGGPHAAVLYNYVKKSSTKTPALFKLTDGNGDVEEMAGPDDLEMATVKEGEFAKNQYLIASNKKYEIQTPGFVHRETGVASLELLVNGNQDSEKLAPGQLRSGRLKMLSAARPGKYLSQRIELSCAYYLKGPRAKLKTKQQIQAVQQQHQQQVAQGKIDQSQQKR